VTTFSSEVSTIGWFYAGPALLLSLTGARKLVPETFSWRQRVDAAALARGRFQAPGLATTKRTISIGL
jgi:hypothetical protein